MNRDTRLAVVVIGALVLLALLLMQGRGPALAEGAAPASTRPAATTSPVERITRSDAEWKRILSPDQYHILREHGTEPPFHNAYWDFHDRGTFVCAGCGLELFESDKKFDSG